MTVQELCEKIRMPEEATQLLLGGCCENGFDKLRLMLEEAENTRKRYDETGIGMRVFFDTMGCFSRFVREHKESYGKYGFDRDWWTHRQLSLKLFRLGTLEYELGEHNGKKAVSVHIPSDADLSSCAVDSSLAEAKRFMKKFFPEYETAVYFCESWLLSPALRGLLCEKSKIAEFAARFTVESVDENADDYKLWIFKDPSLSPPDFPENTSLQRSVKRYVLGGGKIGSALGVLAREIRNKK